MLKWKSTKDLTVEAVLLTLMKRDEYYGTTDTRRDIYKWLKEAEGIMMDCN